MKKLLALLSALMVVFAVTGCASSGNDQSASEDKSASSEAADTATEKQDAAAQDNAASADSADGLNQEMGVDGVTWKVNGSWQVNPSTSGTSFSYMTGSEGDRTVIANVTVLTGDHKAPIESLVTQEQDQKKSSESYASDEWVQMLSTVQDGLDRVTYEEKLQMANGNQQVYYKGYVGKDGLCSFMMTSPDQAVLEAMVNSVTIS